jgi:hypothetical protein
MKAHRESQKWGPLPVRIPDRRRSNTVVKYHPLFKYTPLSDSYVSSATADFAGGNSLHHLVGVFEVALIP